MKNQLIKKLTMFCKPLKISVYEFFKALCLAAKKSESICFEDKNIALIFYC